MAKQTQNQGAAVSAGAGARREPSVRDRVDAIDPRVRNLMQGQTPAMRFILAGLVLSMGAEQSRALLDAIEPNAVGDLNTRIEATGKPLHHYLGKTREQIQRELDGDDEKVDAVVQALRDSGRPLPEDVEAQPLPETMTGVGSPRVGSPGDDAEAQRLDEAARAGGGRPIGNEGMATREPTFGRDQIPFSELSALSDAELRQVEGIDDAQIAEINRLKQAQSGAGGATAGGGQ